MKVPNFESYHIRKWYTQVEDTLANETGELADGETLKKFVIAAAIENPYAGTFSSSLEKIVGNSKLLGEEFARRVKYISGAERIEGYGKACLVGTSGEYEHGNAFLTTVFANPVRDALGGGKSWIPSTGKRGSQGTSIDVPLAHKDALYVRSHYDTVTVTFNDAPAHDEVIVIFAFSTRGRLYARLGGLKASDIEGENGLT